MVERKWRIILVIFIFLVNVTLSSASVNCTNKIIPKPQKMTQGNKTFTLSKKTHYFSDTTLSKNAITYLQNHLKKNAGYRLKSTQQAKQNTLIFHHDTKKVKQQEGYILHIDTDKITIQARDSAGFFYAVISLMQLMHTDIWQERSRKKHPLWKISSCMIKDYPHFEWRGMMLDTSRNFFSKRYVKKFIDRMAQVKLNRFHWHLTDDEGWRIEIKKYPLLTKVGSSRGPGTKLPFSTYPAMRGSKKRTQAGYYTQADIKEIVAYAKARSIEILPEIDVPAHAKAAIISYPKLLNDPHDQSQYRSVQKVKNNTMNPAMESTYVFLDNVIKEVSQLFPFAYIHVGGDEVPKGAWKRSPAVKRLMQKHGLKNNKELQSYFFTRLDSILKKHHKKMMGWEEVRHGNAKLRKSTTVMAWKSLKNGTKLAKKRHHVILSPVQYLYFDQQYTRSKKEPGHTWSTPVSTKKVYAFNVATSSYIQGIHATLWSETLLNENIADYLAWPRMFALSEVAWTNPKRRSWKSFQKRLSSSRLKQLQVQNIHYRSKQ